MTNDQLFERWWNRYSNGYQPLDPKNDPVAGIRDAARAAFHAALSDEDRETCVEILALREDTCRHRSEMVKEKDARMEELYAREALRCQTTIRRLGGEE